MSNRDELVEEMIASFLENDPTTKEAIEGNQEMEEAFKEFAEATVDHSVNRHKAEMEYAKDMVVTNSQPGSSATYREGKALLKDLKEAAAKFTDVNEDQGMEGVVDGDTIQNRAFDHFEEKMNIHNVNHSGANRDEIAEKFEAIIEEQKPTGLGKLIKEFTDRIKDEIDPLPVNREGVSAAKRFSAEKQQSIDEHKDWMKERGQSEDGSPDLEAKEIYEQEEREVARKKRKSEELEEKNVQEAQNTENEQSSDKNTESQQNADLVESGNKITVEYDDGTSVSFNKSKNFDTSLSDDGTVVRAAKDDPDNKYLVKETDKSVEYDLTDLDVGALGKEKLTFKDTDTKGGKINYQVEFNVDQEGNIEVTSAIGDVANKINFKNGDKTLTLDADGQLVATSEEAKELEQATQNPQEVESRTNSNLDADLENIDLSQIQEAGVSSTPPPAQTQKSSQGRGT